VVDKYAKLQLKPKISSELKVVLQTVWEQLLQENINQAVANFTKCFTACMVLAAIRDHFEHLHLPICILKSSPTNRFFSESSTY